MLPIDFTGAWYRHLFSYSAKHGAFDWIRRRVRLASSSENSVSFGGVDLEKDGEWVSQAPEAIFAPLQKGEIALNLLYIHNTIIPKGNRSGALAIERFILADDRTATLESLDPENVTSAPGFIRPARDDTLQIQPAIQSETRTSQR